MVTHCRSTGAWTRQPEHSCWKPHGEKEHRGCWLPRSTSHCRWLLPPARGAEQSLEGTTAVLVSPCQAKSYSSVAQTAHVFECIAPTTHPQLPGGHTGVPPRGWPPPKAALGGADPSRCLGTVFQQAAGAAQGCVGRQHLFRDYLFHKPLNSSSREKEARSHCRCSLLCFWGNTHPGMGRAAPVVAAERESSGRDAGGISGSPGALRELAHLQT